MSVLDTLAIHEPELALCAAVVRGEVRVNGGVRTAGYQFTADIVVYSRREGGFTDTDGPWSTASLVGGNLIYDIKLVRWSEATLYTI